MAAYIRLRTVQVRKGGPHSYATSQTQFQLSLSIQLDQNHNKLKKVEEQVHKP